MKISKYIIPLLVILTIIGGFNLRHLFALPTTSQIFAEGDGETITCKVSGVKCRGTAGFFTSLYEETDGILSITTFAADNQAIIKYDPDKISQDSIVVIMEQLIPFNDGTEMQVFECLEIE
jgi:hypothetical protein